MFCFDYVGYPLLVSISTVALSHFNTVPEVCDRSSRRSESSFKDQQLAELRVQELH